MVRPPPNWPMWMALAASAALVVVLARKNRALGEAYSELRLHAALPYAGYVVPTFSTTTLGGARVTVGEASRPGARQVLFIMTTTCPFCRATLPVWKQIADSLRHIAGRAVEILAISLDSIGPTRAFADSQQLSYPVLVFPQRKLARLYRAVAVPQTLVLDAEGRVLYARTGLLNRPVIVDSVLKAATQIASPDSGARDSLRS